MWAAGPGAGHRNLSALGLDVSGVDLSVDGAPCAPAIPGPPLRGRLGHGARPRPGIPGWRTRLVIAVPPSAPPVLPTHWRPSPRPWSLAARRSQQVGNPVVPGHDSRSLTDWRPPLHHRVGARCGKGARPRGGNGVAMAGRCRNRDADDAGRSGWQALLHHRDGTITPPRSAGTEVAAEVRMESGRPIPQMIFDTSPISFPAPTYCARGSLGQDDWRRLLDALLGGNPQDDNALPDRQAERDVVQARLGAAAAWLSVGG
jgi:hypothetical protein